MIVIHTHTKSWQMTRNFCLHSKIKHFQINPQSYGVIYLHEAQEGDFLSQLLLVRHQVAHRLPMRLHLLEFGDVTLVEGKEQVLDPHRGHSLERLQHRMRQLHQ